MICRGIGMHSHVADVGEWNIRNSGQIDGADLTGLCCCEQIFDSCKVRLNWGQRSANLDILTYGEDTEYEVWIGRAQISFLV